MVDLSVDEPRKILTGLEYNTEQDAWDAFDRENLPPADFRDGRDELNRDC